MIQSMAGFFTGIMQRWLPNAFLFAITLTLVVLLCGVLFEHSTPAQMIDYWGGGVWNLLTFSMQMVLILVTGHVVAQSPAVKAGLGVIAGLAKTPVQAVILMTVVAMCCCWINWGFGLISSALVAREMARRVEGVHYPLLVASAYSGMLVWHAGLSGSIPLKLATPEDDALGELMRGVAIPLSDTIFSLPIMVIALALILTVPIINCLMIPPSSETHKAPKFSDEVSAEDLPLSEMTPAERLENSAWPSLLLGGMGLWYLVMHFARGGSLGLNTMILVFLSSGLILNKTTARYLHALSEAIKGVGGIIVQYPLYAGIMGMMVGSGLAASVSEWFVAISTPTTFPLFTFLSAGVVNFFVPSGGGQWAVQAPIVIPAAEALGVPLNKAAMAVAFGDAWTNMIQPLWALPLLGIAGLSIKDIMGYCTVTLLWSGAIICAGMLLLF